MFQNQEWGFGTENTDKIDTGVHIYNLLKDFAIAAATSHRRELIFSPFPTVRDSATQRLRLDPEAPNWQLLGTLLGSLPGAEEVREGVQSCISQREESCLLLPLAQWVWCSNRAELAMLPRSQVFPQFDTDAQYVVLQEDPSKQHAFDALCAKEGYFYAFHGSPAENWHSIIRSGLKVMSNRPQYMLNGAAHGEGIYLATQASTSLSYLASRHYVSSSTSTTKNPTNGTLTTTTTISVKPPQGTTFNCLAICQVAGKPEVYTGGRNTGGILVVKEPSRVCLRFLLVFRGAVTSREVTTTDEAFVAQANTLLGVQPVQPAPVQPDQPAVPAIGQAAEQWADSVFAKRRGEEDKGVECDCSPLAGRLQQDAAEHQKRTASSNQRPAAEHEHQPAKSSSSSKQARGCSKQQQQQAAPAESQQQLQASKKPPAAAPLKPSASAAACGGLSSQ
eukprot:CAMPEP_0181334324 /NCGR_PEP_ID=MMETSP1101-20121128/26184_1 /TAXON_ID=46948 /ORGANISM="Rhodomonas abbreviata, Strain Caron Lab Isolate" /LENGTH=447 /DNA_ID=CAMNT_0023444263 /DNA_START=57 /DNA_END=1401 /DNA_ORIENTATION=+